MYRVTVLLFSMLVGLAGFLQFGCSGSLKLGSLPPDELFELGRKYHNEHKYIRAIEVFQTVVYNFPGESIVDSAQYYLALSYFGNKDYTLAEREFNRLLLNYPSSVYVIHAQFMRAVCFFEGTPKHYGLDQSDLETAIRQFEDFIIDHPESELLPDARAYLLTARTRLAHKYYDGAMVYVHIERDNPAKTYFQKVIDDFTDTEYAAKSSYRLAELEYKRKNYEKALEMYSNFLVVFPEHEWAGKASERAEEAAFKWAEVAYKNGDMVKARELLEAFTKDYPESKRIDKANKYLQQIGESPTGEPGVEQADSATEG
jgi:outer membrane protein assembly factor BamD